MKDKNSRWTYSLYIAVAMIVSLISATIWDVFSQTEALTVVKIVSDSFTLPGVLFIGISLLGWVSSKGAFDIFGFSFQGLLNLWKKESYQKQETFYDYRVKKDENRKPFNLPMFLTGTAFLVLGIIMTVIFLIMES
ncbi:MAG: DUF3899 domain-containing protein [Clostridia bacterium]|nr:DUF3899 domain-containing protein [Clostridia bacterium]